jgi:deoxyribonuclease-4
MLLGTHCSISGGVYNAFDQAESEKVDAFQIFTKNQRQWQEKEIDEEAAQEFRDRFEKSSVEVAFSHSIYLLNLASPEDANAKRSINSLTTEVKRCTQLGLRFTVLHPGAAMDQTEDVAIKRIAEGLKQVLADTPDSPVKIALENTAGQGTAIGHRFEHLRDIMELVGSDRIGMCFDTCHAFAAGYDIRTQSAFEDVMAELDQVVGLQHLDGLHLNDSKNDLGTRKDRHEHIGKGFIGIEPYKVIMKEFKHVPKVLETPEPEEMNSVNLKTLRDLA